MIKNILISLITVASIIQAQDTTKSEAFKRKPFEYKRHIFQPKYNSYPLVAGYLLTKEANSGDPFAQHELGIRYLTGRGFQADTAQAVYWIQKAAMQNLAAAQFNLGIMLLNGIGTPWNPFEAFKYFGKAAAAGMPQAAYIYGVIYTDNLVVNRNLNEAYKWISFAADKGMEAAIKLKKKLEENGIKASSEKAPVVQNTSPVAPQQSLLSSNWELDFAPIGEDSLMNTREKAVVEKLLKEKSEEVKKYVGFSSSKDTVKYLSNLDILDKASKNGSPEALMLLGKTYEFGIGVNKSEVKAALSYLRAIRLGARKPVATIIEFTKDSTFFESLKKGVDNNNADAMYVWAALTALGFDYQLTDKQALDLLLKASSQKHIPSLLESGIIYVTGAMVEKDTTKAIDYWQEAFQLGSSEGKVRIIFINIAKLKDKYNNKEELNLLRKFATQGSVLAESVLAYCYQHGYGVKSNLAKAGELYRNAASRGSEAAYAALKKMYDEIRPDEAIFQIIE